MIEKNSTSSMTQPQVYTDLSALQQIKAQGQTDKNAALKNIAHQFESMMVQMMMKSMRQANAVFSDGDITSSSDQKFYQDMFDNQLGLTLSQGRGFGIADAMMRQLQGRYGNNAATTVAPTADHSVEGLVRQQTLSALSSSSTSSSNMSGSSAGEAPASIPEAIYEFFQTENSTDGTAHDAEKNADAAHLDGTPENFVNALRPAAERVAQQLGVDSRVLLSQSALETGWGQKVIQRSGGGSSFNFFNIKADSNWRGAVVTVPTIEYQNGVAVRDWATFRAYNSPEESFSDYAKLIAENPRYQQALQNVSNPRAYVKALADAGYATDPHYADKVLALLDGEHMQRTASVTGEL